MQTQSAISKAGKESRMPKSMKPIHDPYGKNRSFLQLFARVVEQMLEAELTEKLGYDRYVAEGYNSGNSRNGHYSRKMRTSRGDSEIRVPRDLNGTLPLELLKKDSSKIEEALTAVFAKGIPAKDVEEILSSLYGNDLSPKTITAIADRVWPLVREWQNRPLEEVYAFLCLEAAEVKLDRTGVTVYTVLGVDLNGLRELLGQWAGDGDVFWLSVMTDLRSRGVRDVLLGSADGGAGFQNAIQKVFPKPGYGAM